MGMRLKALTGILALACVWTPLSLGQQQSTRLEQTRLIHFNHVDVGLILAHMAFDYETTVGFEVDPAKLQSPIDLDLRDVVAFRQVLDGIVKAEPGYQWRENDGAIEVRPINGGSSLLDTPIQSFQVKDVSRFAAINRLLSLPEVQAIASSMNLKTRPPIGLSEQTEKLSFDLSGVTLRQALNRIATDSGGRFWAFRRYPDGTFEVTLR
jgi:hypothetical protein